MARCPDYSPAGEIGHERKDRREHSSGGECHRGVRAAGRCRDTNGTRVVFLRAKRADRREESTNRVHPGTC